MSSQVHQRRPDARSTSRSSWAPNLDMAQVLVQNRVAIAEAKLPEEVKRQGVTTKKKSPSILLCVNLISPDGALRPALPEQLRDAPASRTTLARIKGVGDVTFLGPRDYSMRVWLDPEKLAARDMTAGDVINGDPRAERAGRGRPASASRPSPTGQNFQFTDQHARAGSRPRSSSATSSSRPATTGSRPTCATWSPTTGRARRASSWAPRTTTSTATSTASRRSRWPSSSCPAPTPSRPPTAIRAKMEELEGRLPGGDRLPHRLRHHRVRRRVDPRGLQDADRGVRPGLHRRAGLPAELAGDAHPDDRRAGVAHRHVRRHGAAGLLAEQPVAVRPGAGDRHRGRRRDRRGRERRALDGARACRRATRTARRWTR